MSGRSGTPGLNLATVQALLSLQTVPPISL
jgi:hypothetical protein